MPLCGLSVENLDAPVEVVALRDVEKRSHVVAANVNAETETPLSGYGKRRELNSRSHFFKFFDD